MNHLLKGALTAASIALAFTPQANAKNTKSKTPNVQIISGLYVGAHAGFTETQMQNKESFFFEPTTGLTGLFNGNTGNNPLVDTGKREGAIWGAIFGARHIADNNIAFGFEIDISTRNQKLISTNQIDLRLMAPVGTLRPTTTNLKHKFSITPKVFIGYRIAPQWLLTAKVGANFSYFNLHNTLQALPAAPITKTDTSQDFSSVGLELGIGGEYAATNSISITADISYTYFKEMKIMLKNPTNGFIIGSTHTARIKPRFVTAKVGVIYKF